MAKRTRKFNASKIKNLDNEDSDIEEEPVKKRKNRKDEDEEDEQINNEDEVEYLDSRYDYPTRTLKDNEMMIRELDPEMIPPNYQTFQDPKSTGVKLAVIGKPGTGKSWLIRSLLYEKSYMFPVAQVYSGTEDSTAFYKSIFPDTFVFNKYTHEDFIKYVKRQKIAKRYIPEYSWSVVLKDDCTEDPRIFNHPLILGTYKNGRHWRMWHLLSLQYSMDIKPVIRTNLDGVFILREPLLRNRKRLFENYVSCIDDFSDFCDIMDQITNDFTALYINNRTQSNKTEDCLFFYKARDDIPDDFKFGCNSYWQYHYDRYNTHYVESIMV